MNIKRSVYLFSVLLIIAGLYALLPIGCGKGSPTTPAPTATPVPLTATPTNTATVTYTSTATSTPTITFTATPTSTVDTFPAEGFEETSVPTSWESWHVGSTATVLALSTAQAHTGSQSAYTQVTFTAGGQLGQIQDYLTKPLNLTGKTLSFWYYIDQLPSASGSTGGIYVESLGGNGGEGNLVLQTGVWIKVTCPISMAGDPSSITNVGFYIESGSTGPFNTVNFYMDDVTIQ